jgi:hypothetical protein
MKEKVGGRDLSHTHMMEVLADSRNNHACNCRKISMYSTSGIRSLFKAPLADRNLAGALRLKVITNINNYEHLFY